MTDHCILHPFSNSGSAGTVKSGESMKKKYLIVLVMLALMLLPLSLASRADEEDDTGTPTGSTLDPDTLWRLGDAAWNRREYDDAASIFAAFCDQNPDNPNTLEGLWRVYCVYHDYRPDQDRRKKAYEKGINGCVRWQRKFAQTDKNRAASAYYYNAILFERELGRPAGIMELMEGYKKYPDTNQNHNLLWTVAEWLREANRYQEAITYYNEYRNKLPLTELAAAADVRAGWMWEALHNNAAAAECYKRLQTTDYNWGQGNVHWGALDAARHLKAIGEDAAARSLALKLLDKTPKEWYDLRAQASQLLGINAKRIVIYPHMNYHYTSTDRISVNGSSKVTFQREVPVLLRLQNVTKADAFSGTLSLTPRFEVATGPEGMQKTQDDKGRDVYSADIVAPDKQNGDIWYRFTEKEHQDEVPDNTIITRSWAKQGQGWGEISVRVQSPARWNIYIMLPNNKTNPNNISTTGLRQPDEVRDDGKTFRWYDWYELSQGVTIKMPVEVGGGVEEFYPQVRLERWSGGRQNAPKSSTGDTATYDTDEFFIKLKSPNSFPYGFEFPGVTDLTLTAITK